MVKIAMRIAAGLVVLVGISFVGLTMSSGHATTSTAAASVTVAAACTMSSVIDTAHNTTISNGTYKEDIGKTTLKVVCNDNSGFSIYAIGYSNDTFGNNKLVANVGGSLSPTNDIVTGTATSGNTSNWAMKVSAVNGAYSPTVGSDTNGTFSNYHIVPDKYAKVATFTSTTDAVVGSSIEATYRAYVSSIQPAGTYTGKVKYTMVHPASAMPNQPMDCDPNSICYWPNAEGSVVDSMGDQSVDSIATTTELWATNFRRDGYGFAGWSDKFDWVLNENDADGNGTGPNEGYHIYGPNATITTPSNMTEKGLSLYAVWAKSNGNLQGWNYCSALGTGKVTALTDQRDDNTYAVAKLADGKCWMIENLRLDNTNSDNATGALAQGYNSSFIGLAYPETANFNIDGVANSLYSTNGSTSAPAITGNDTGYRFPRFNNQNTASSSTNMTGTGNNTYSYGNYYTWPAAVADTSYYSTNNQVISNTSICPKGWRLPQGGNKTRVEQEDDNDFWTLAAVKLNNGVLPNNYSSSTYPYYTGNEATGLLNALRSFPNNFVYSGVFYGSSASNRGGGGYYWSSSVDSYGRSYSLYFRSSLVYPGAFNIFKYYGFSVRCLVGS